jgi:2-amino-4-hydroxy-6-hydroxymethyldihydropteridine diphosphokinase
VETALSANTLKVQVLRPIEARLGRQRSQDKNTPRTIDLDILMFDDEVVDAHIWDYAHLAVPLAECFPTLAQPSNNLCIKEIAQELQKTIKIQKTDLFSKLTL